MMRLFTSLKRAIPFKDFSDVCEALCCDDAVSCIVSLAVPGARSQRSRPLGVEVLCVGKHIRCGEDGETLRVDGRKQMRGIKEDWQTPKQISYLNSLW